MLMIQTFQRYCKHWNLEVFKVLGNISERSFRFIEEALELAQATGLTKEEVLRVVDYVYSRPVGEPKQEVGGVMVTLAILCSAADIDLEDASWLEFKRIDTAEMKQKIHDKQAFKDSQGLVRHD